MAIRIVRLGSERAAGEGLRIGTVRHLPRGVPKAEYASRNLFDVWYPNLAPAAETVKKGLAARTEREWMAYERAYRREMATPENRRTLGLLAALSHRTDFSIGCYCQDENRCHRSILRSLLEEHGAKVVR